MTSVSRKVPPLPPQLFSCRKESFSGSFPSAYNKCLILGSIYCCRVQERLPHNDNHTGTLPPKICSWQHPSHLFLRGKELRRVCVCVCVCVCVRVCVCVGLCILVHAYVSSFQRQILCILFHCSLMHSTKNSFLTESQACYLGLS